MMNFRIIKNSLVNKILTPAMGTSFRISKGQEPDLTAGELLDNSRLLSVYTSHMDFDGRETGPVRNKPVIYLDFFVSANSRVDLSVIENPLSTPAQITTAMSAKISAKQRADESMDEFWNIIWDLVMNANNDQLGLDLVVGAFPIDTGIKLSNRYLRSLQKDQPTELGEYVILTGRAILDYNTVEVPSGLTPTTATEGVQDEIQFADQATQTADANTKTGINIINQ